ncbi:MAG: CRISPR-associated helicase Cas3' [Nitrospiraceae bacterium]|nr:CRISPR-associated helicase Cas3' [Nitrospiraceae bacterium]
MKATALSPRNGNTYCAHTPGKTGEWHRLTDHLQAVAERARSFAEPFGAGDIAYWLGLLHDIGKFNPGFQSYLREAESARKNNRTSPMRGPDHSSAGMVVARTAYSQDYPQLGQTAQGAELAWPIASHHAGLADLASLEERLVRKSHDPAVSQAIQIAVQIMPELNDLLSAQPTLPLLPTNRSREFFIRMLLSALVDADHLDTEAWLNPEKHARRERTLSSTSDLLEAVIKGQEKLITTAPRTSINQARREIYYAVLSKAASHTGFFRLSVPTGGGKTRTALAFALKHAKEHNLKRVIFAIPYTSIIEQTADEFRKIVGPDNVLEHHSALAVTDAEQDPNNWTRLATDNWDAPIIVTTTVQLFESLFSNRPGKVRKLHNLARSVIVLDEAQMLPTPLLNPILDALSELVQPRYGASIVLCTATQPALDESLGFPALANVREIAPEPQQYFRRLSRVHYEIHSDESWSWEDVAEQMHQGERALCIVNTKAQARALFAVLDDPEALHLSTNMCPAHRLVTLRKIRALLEEDSPCRVVSTQLVEAGVDLDFPQVLRALGPLDSIVQAAGRCNREGKLRRKGRVIVFRPEEHSLPRGVYRAAAGLAETMLAQNADLDELETFQRYFHTLYQTLVNRDAHGIQALRSRFNYPKVAEEFKMIPGDTAPVVIRDYEPSKVAAILARGIDRWSMRALQPYLVNVYQDKLSQLEQDGLVQLITPGLWEWRGTYHPKLGMLEQHDVERTIV